MKSAEATSFDRWELWQTAGGPYGHLRRNLQAPESDVGADGVFVVAELVGPAAEPVVDFITDRSPTYPCRNTYFFLGPNSNTYPQWVLDNTGWNAELPATAIGKDYDFLRNEGVAAIFGPGTPIPDAAAEVLEVLRSNSAA